MHLILFESRITTNVLVVLGLTGLYNRDTVKPRFSNVSVFEQKFGDENDLVLVQNFGFRTN